VKVRYLFNRKYHPLLCITNILYRVIIPVFLLTIYVTSAYAQQDRVQVIDYAKQQIEEDDYESALSTLNMYLAANKNDTVALYWKSYCFYKLQNDAAAIENYTLLLKINPRCYPANIDMANIFIAQKKYTEALPYYNAAVSMNAFDADLLNSRGMCYYYCDRFELAIKDFKKVIALTPDNYEAYNNLGSAIYNNQNIAEASLIDLGLAEQNYNKSIELKPDYQLALRNRGIVRFYLNKLADAYNDLLVAAQSDPTDVNAYYYLGKTLYKQKNYAVAIQFFDNAINLVDSKADFFIDRGICLLDIENIPDARADFYKAFQLGQKNALASFHLARTYAADGDMLTSFIYLRDAKKYGLFDDPSYYTLIYKDIYFKNWSKDKTFVDFIQGLKFSKNK